MQSLQVDRRTVGWRGRHLRLVRSIAVGVVLNPKVPSALVRSAQVGIPRRMSRTVRLGKGKAEEGPSRPAHASVANNGQFE